MEKYITDERTGLKYELVGDYYLVAGEDESEQCSIGIWGQRHLRYIKQYKRSFYTEMLISGKLNGYLADIDEQAENMFFRMVKQMAEKQGVTEQLKANNQMLWVGRMNNIRASVTEIVNHDLIYIYKSIRRLFFTVVAGWIYAYLLFIFLRFLLMPSVVRAPPETNSSDNQRTILLLSPVCGDCVSPGFVLSPGFSGPAAFATIVNSVEAVPVDELIASICLPAERVAR